jgi:hypothetical protein
VPFASIEELEEAEPEVILLEQATRLVAEMASIDGSGARRQLITGSESAARQLESGLSAFGGGPTAAPTQRRIV